MKKYYIFNPTYSMKGSENEGKAHSTSSINPITRKAVVGKSFGNHLVPTNLLTRPIKTKQNKSQYN